ncbi:hypothetical protein PRUPE_2G057100 [Prunus persica]|nr:hypothetical protein PRUPE_2G057100 [Prunus persica]
MITIDNGRIQMHDLLEKLGKDIVHEECPNDPGKRSRLWFYEDVEQVLTESTGTRNIQGIMVNLPNPAKITLNPECFRNMVNLEIFINCNASLCGHINYLPNTLRLIHWDRCQLQSLPPNFQGNRLVEFNMPNGCQLQSLPPNFQGNHLVEFNMPCSHIRQLDGFNFKHLSKLTTMNLMGCQFLEKIPDLSGIPNIKYLDLTNCTRLVEVHGSVGFLDKLVELDLSGCVKLMRFGTTLRLKSLEELCLVGCETLESFPEIEVEMESLWCLDISGSGVRELPPSIAYLTGLRLLDLRGCFNLTRFATLRLKSLENLDLRNCKSLESFPEIEVEIESLRFLRISESGIRGLPPSIAYLTGLRLLDLRGCFNLTRFATLRLKSLEELDLSNCKSLESFPEIEVEMESLRVLRLSGSGIRGLPPSIAYLTGLRLLNLSGFFNLTRFATLRLKSLENLDLSNCKSLESFPEIEVEMESLRVLRLSGSGIRGLPPSIAYLTGLRLLDLRGCFNLTRFATLRLKSLENLDLSNCKSLESFPEIEVEMESLRVLRLSGSGIRGLPPSIAYLTGLRLLDLRGCFNLTRFATLRLKSLENLDLSNCKSLESFPEIEVEMESLWGLNISGSGVRELPPSIAYLTGLRLLDLRGCFNLTRFATLRMKSLKNLDLSDCKSLESFPEIEVEMESLRFLRLSGSGIRGLPPSIAYLTGLRLLDLRGCFNLTRFATLRLKSLEELDLSNCKSLESFPEIEVEMESLRVLRLSGSGIRGLPPSIAYLTGLRLLDLRGCFNLTRFATLRLKSLEELDLSDCKSLENFPEIEVEMESLWFLSISGSGVRELPSSIAYFTGLEILQADYCENFTVTGNSELLPNLYEFSLMGCNLSKISFLRLLCWSTVTELFLSQSNFVNLPISFSKFVNLRNLYLINCQSLLEIPEQVLPRRIEFVELDNCTSLEKIPKLAWVLLDNCTSLEKIPELPRKDDHMYLSLTNCVRLCGYDITEHIFLNQVSVSSPHSLFEIILPGDEVPKWFSCCKDATTVRQYLSCRYDAGCEVSFEIPPNLKWETLRLVLCAGNIGSAKILLNGKLVNVAHFELDAVHLYDECVELLESHVYLTSIPLLETRQSNRHARYVFEEPPTKQVNTCQVIFDLRGKVPAPVKIPCGVHLLGHRVADVSETDVVDHGPTQLLPDAMAVDDDIYDDQHQDCGQEASPIRLHGTSSTLVIMKLNG